jgi:16S rRNA (cytidine1402-2'-O)-methyltransferase
MSGSTGILYIIATPIGNLADISQRALDTLRSVDLIAAEDTRQTSKLLQAYGITTPMRAYHEHNEAKETPRLVSLIASGIKLALVSDAGTPLISDPGFRLVREARNLELTVIPIPGPSALICALSASGLPSDRFLFIGFPPRNTTQRIALFQSLLTEPGTLIFYEASSRLQATLLDLETVFAERRHMVLARELTKRYETFLCGTPGAIAARLAQEPIQTKGEHVLLVTGAGHHPPQESATAERILRILLEELPVKQAAKLAARISGNTRNELYKLALTIKQEL